MIKPIRIKRSRQHKQVSPNGLPIVYVGRGSRYGNPFVICQMSDGLYAISHECDYSLHQITKAVGCCNKTYSNKYDAAVDAVKCYKMWLLPYSHKDGSMADFLLAKAQIDNVIINLKNKNLSCWCDIDAPCHADLLLKLAND